MREFEPSPRSPPPNTYNAVRGWRGTSISSRIRSRRRVGKRRQKCPSQPPWPSPMMGLCTAPEKLWPAPEFGGAIRAKEADRDDALFCDPFADKLAGEDGRRMLAAAIAHSGAESTWQIVVRTRFWNEALLRTGLTQAVILAAGMDARAYRLPWPEHTTVYEVDQPAVIAAKAELLADDAGAYRLGSTSPRTGRPPWRRRVSMRPFPASGSSRGCCSTSTSPRSAPFRPCRRVVSARLSAAVRRGRQNVARSAVDGAVAAVHGTAGFTVAVRHGQTLRPRGTPR